MKWIRIQNRIKIQRIIKNKRSEKKVWDQFDVNKRNNITTNIVVKFELSLPVLFQIILSFEILPTNLANESQWIVGPLVYHQVVAFGEPPLAILANVFAFGAHFSTELSTTHVVLDLHDRKHFARFLCLISFCGSTKMWILFDYYLVRDAVS